MVPSAVSIHVTAYAIPAPAARRRFSEPVSVPNDRE
jgi:hypothetical protein